MTLVGRYPDRVRLWIGDILGVQDPFRLRSIRSLGLALASAYSRADPVTAGRVFDHLSTSGSCVRLVIGEAAISSELVALFGAADHPEFDRRRAPGPAPRWTIPPDRPLQGLRVLDMTRVLAGPVATRFLAGFGAEVLRIDPPGWDEPAIVPGVTLGKRCARLDLRQPADRNTWEGLLRAADVVVHGYRPGALAGLGLDAGRRRTLCPGLVDVSLDAYGWDGPWQGRRGFDSLV